MNTTFKNQMREIMQAAWQFVKVNGLKMAEALRCAWRNFKLRIAMHNRIVKFYFKKVDGSIREAYGTLQNNMVPVIKGVRSSSPLVQVYYDTEKESWRSFKKINLLKIE